MSDVNMERCLRETSMLDFSSEKIQRLVHDRGWQDLVPFERIKAIYNYVRDEILFGYNVDDSIPASRVLSDGYGQCNTKGTLFMALLRACGIPCRVHGFTIHKSLQKGAMTGLVYGLPPENVFHSWVEVLLEGRWYELEAFILDREYLTKLRQININCQGAFCGYGVAVKDFQNPIIDFDRNNTYIQSEGINQDFGVYDSPDDLLKEHHQEMSRVKAFAYRHMGRHQMNRNVKKIRKSQVENKKHLPIYGVGPIYCACIVAATTVGILLSVLGVLPSAKVAVLKNPMVIAGVLIAGLGFYVWFQAAFRIGKYIEENKLCVDGIFAVVRNPVYSGFMLMCTGALLISDNLWLLILPPLYWVAMTVLMKHTEEKWLLELYGQEYMAYCMGVNRCIPWFCKRKQGEKK